jgi:hypothetical protein
MGLDRDSPLAFKVHRVQNLFRHFSLSESPGFFQQSVSQGGLAMVDMGNDAKVAYIFLIQSTTR